MTTKKAPAKVDAKKPPVPAATPAPQPKPTGLQIVAMQVENIKGVSFARIRPHGPSMVIVSGPNGSGKSTILDAVDWALCGLGNVPTQPIKAGQNSARIQVDLGEFKVTRHFTRVEGGEKSTFLSKLSVEGNGVQFRTPQALLDGLMQRISFDPLEFIGMEPKRQFEALRSMVVLDVNLDELDQKKQEAYEMRREAGRIVDTAKARWRPMTPPESGLPAAPIDTQELAQQLQDAAVHNEKIAQQEREAASMAEESRRMLATAAHNRTEAARLLKEAATLEEGAARKQRAADQTKPTEAKIDPTEVGTKLQAAQETNRKLEYKARYDGLQKETEKAQAAWEDLDKEVKALEQQRADALARAKMPIAGLEIGAGEVLYKKLPFEQASNAEQIRVSAALAIASSPKLRVMCIRDGSLLDDNSMRILAEMCEGENYQLWIERVGGSGPAMVEMRDGEASGQDVEEVKQ